MTWALQHERGDPAEVLARRQEEAAAARRRAITPLHHLFEDDMAREADFRQRIGPELHERLEQWGWVVRDRPRQGSSPTAEICRRLAIQAGAIRPGDAKQPSELDVHQAMEIERAVANPLMPRRARAMLVGYYVARMHPHAICRAGGIRYAEFDSEMAKSCGFLSTLLERLAFRREAAHNPRHNLTADTQRVAV